MIIAGIDQTTVSNARWKVTFSSKLLTGRIVTGPAAVTMGLASECLPKDDLIPRAMAIAEDVAVNTAPVSVALSKKLLWLGSSADMKEGVRSFLEKRPPEWKMSVTKDMPESF